MTAIRQSRPDLPWVINGKTSKHRVRIEYELEPGYGHYRVWIDGREVGIQRVGRLRDGGTTTVDLAPTTIHGAEKQTARRVTFPHKLGNPDHRPRLDGEVIVDRIPVVQTVWDWFKEKRRDW